MTARPRVPCVLWPCHRCDRAGRTSWRARESWHLERRRARGRVYAWVSVALTVPFAPLTAFSIALDDPFWPTVSLIAALQGIAFSIAAWRALRGGVR